MMKKIIVLALATLMMISMAACAKTKIYENGSYLGTGDARENAYETAVVTVKDGKIADIILKHFKIDDTESDYDFWTGEKASDGVTRPNIKRYRLELAAAMLEKQSADVDAISGATLSSEGWKQAVERALKSAEKK